MFISRFPSVEKFYSEKLDVHEKSQDKVAASAIDRFGGMYPPRSVPDLGNVGDVAMRARSRRLLACLHWMK